MGFSDNLKSILKERRLKQADLCRMTGVQTSLISDYLAGKKGPTLGNAILIAEGLGISLDTLVAENNNSISEEEQELGPNESLEVDFKEFETNTQLAVLSLLKQGDKSLNELLNITNDLDHYRYIRSVYIGRSINELYQTGYISQYNAKNDGIYQVYCHIEDPGIAYRKYLIARFKKLNLIMESYIYYDPDADNDF